MIRALALLLLLCGCSAPFAGLVPGGEGAARGFLDTGGLSYGDIVPACETPQTALGTEVARYPERGRGDRLYDTSPGDTALRPHFLTGFSDGCPRKFLAALAIFGGPAAYETTRASSAGAAPRSETDVEYEAIRRRVCAAPLGQTCPARRFSRLESRAVFVSVYQRFGTNPTWADMLIYDGEVIAKDFKSLR